MPIEGFQERIRATIDGASVNAFAKKCGLAESVVRSYLTGRSLPGLDKLYSLAHGGNVRVEWLATGEEPMRPGERSAELATTEAHGYLVPHYDIEASAGPGTIDHQELIVEHIAFKPEFLRDELGIMNLSSLALIRARGDSMHPTISPGDLLLIDRGEITDRIDGIYLLMVDDRLIVKRVQFGLSGEIHIISDNPNYRPQFVEPGRAEIVRLVGRVVWSGRRIG